MDVPDLIDALTEQGGCLLDSARLAGLAAPVPTCPGWSIADLLAHAGYVHRWAAAHVAGRCAEPLDEAATDATVGPVPTGDALFGWYADSHARLVATLRSAPADVECWAFLTAPSPLAFWARRQAHECAIHRADADRAAGRESSFDAGFAADGIDELLGGFLARRRGRLVSTPARSLAVAPTDRAVGWTLHIEPESRTVVRDVQAADCTVRGAASDLYQLLWNRRGRDGLRIDGDAAVLDLFAAKAQVRWS